MQKNKIPKVINYCWFGGNEKPDIVIKCINSWKKYCPDYEIKEWNESNFDINICTFVKEAYESKKWAFVTDYARLYIIYTYGGLYFDTDVELISSIDKLLKYDAFFAKEDDIYFNTGIGFGGVKGNKLIHKMLLPYENRSFIKSDGSFDTTTCPIVNTEVIEKEFGKFKDIDIVIKDNICFLGKEYFCPIDYETNIMNITQTTLGIHHFSQSWLSGFDKFKVNIKRVLFRIFGRERVKKIIKMIKR